MWWWCAQGKGTVRTELLDKASALVRQWRASLALQAQIDKVRYPHGNGTLAPIAETYVLLLLLPMMMHAGVQGQPHPHAAPVLRARQPPRGPGATGEGRR